MGDSNGITVRGKPVGQTPVGVPGQNDYMGCFSGDEAMKGVYGGYDGPCPPWNDSIVHRYHFTLYAIDIPSLELSGSFTGQDALVAIEGHVLGSASHASTYSMTPDVSAA